MLVLSTLTPAAAGPRDTKEAWDLLLAACNMTIPPQSSCRGEYGQTGAPKVRDLLAMELAYLNRGENTIVGSCKGSGAKSCNLFIGHKYGEDQYAAEIHFTVSNKGEIDINTLTCIMTP